MFITLSFGVLMAVVSSVFHVIQGHHLLLGFYQYSWHYFVTCKIIRPHWCSCHWEEEIECGRQSHWVLKTVRALGSVSHILWLRPQLRDNIQRCQETHHPEIPWWNCFQLGIPIPSSFPMRMTYALVCRSWSLQCKEAHMLESRQKYWSSHFTLLVVKYGHWGNTEL